MKNHQYIRQLSAEELAKLLVKETEANEGTEMCYSVCYDRYETRYYMPNGDYEYDYDEAIEATIDWLNAERMV